MLRSPQDVYARHLLSLRGYPLWTPEPSHQLLVYRRDGLRIGDVGVVIPEDGCFDVFFNICLPQDHAFHRATGVPDNFQPIKLTDMDIRTVVNTENQGRTLGNSSVKFVRTVEQPADDSSSARTSGLEYDFTLSSSEGALLILPEGAERYDLRNHHRFLEAATQHGADWYRFVEEKVGQIIGNDSLYLITGLHKTTSWSLAAFEKTSGTAEYPAQFKISRAGGDNTPATYAWETTRALDWHAGPLDNYGLANQSVFVRGFKVALRTGIFGTRLIKVKADSPSTQLNSATSFGAVPGQSWLGYMFGGTSAGRTSQSSGSGTQDDVASDSALEDVRDEIQNKGALAVGEDVVIHRVPEESQAFHPSDIINRYLLNKEPGANIAITHDDDWIALLEEDLLQAEGVTEASRLERLVSQRYDIMSEGGAVYLRSPSKLDTFGVEEMDTTMDSEDSNVTVTGQVPPAEQEETMDERNNRQVNLMTSSLIPDAMSQMGGDLTTTGISTAPMMHVHNLYHCKWLEDGMTCDQDFAESTELQTHIRRAHCVQGRRKDVLECQWSTATGPCGTMCDRNGLQDHISGHSSVSYVCGLCGLGFNQGEGLFEHQKKTHPESVVVFHPPPPHVLGLFIDSDHRIEAPAWHDMLPDNASSCKLVRLEFCRTKSNKPHEFLLFHFSHPTHPVARAVVVVDRRQASVTSATSKNPVLTLDWVHVVGQGESLSNTYGKHDQLCVLEFSSDPQPVAYPPPSVTQISTLLLVVSRHRPNYTPYEYNCYWYADAVFEACERLFPGYQEDRINYDDRGLCRLNPTILRSHTVLDICFEYCVERERFMRWLRRNRQDFGQMLENERRAQDVEKEVKPLRRELGSLRAHKATQRIGGVTGGKIVASPTGSSTRFAYS